MEYTTLVRILEREADDMHMDVTVVGVQPVDGGLQIKTVGRYCGPVAYYYRDDKTDTWTMC